MVVEKCITVYLTLSHYLLQDKDAIPWLSPIAKGRKLNINSMSDTQDSPPSPL